jgi:hypothetical protein
LTIEQRPGFSLESPTSRARWRLQETRHSRVFSLARRLLRGEIIDLTDRHGRTWRGTACSLAVVQRGTGEIGPVFEDVAAFDVAAELVALASDDD